MSVSMERLILNKLLEWKNSPYRKPLILKGVRQVGKTWILKEFGRRYYENTAYFNFDENEEYKQFFETTKDVDRILQNLMLASGYKILPEKTLIIFDEVQDCPKVINAMKYFCENAPQYHIACAGSLLGIALAKPSSFPVGKVNFMQIDPMTFTEFLLANGDENLVKYLESVDTLDPIPDAFFNPLYEKLKMYYVTGGMPESVKMWTEARDVSAMQEVLSDIIGAYERDFAKHPNLTDFPKISMIWKSVPSQLARENKKFIYKVVKEGARAREYEDALQWLVDARLVHKIYRNSALGLPVAAYGGKREIMQNVSPAGAVYQAGTLSGNPLAMTAGLETLKIITAEPECGEPDYSRQLTIKTKKLILGVAQKAKEAGVTLQVQMAGSMFGFFFNDL